MISKEIELREQILDLVKQYYQTKFADKEFIPTKNKVHYAGRVFDENELVNLVDASLDFWLTAGRYAKQFEKEFASFFGLQEAILVNSGSSANLVAVTTLCSPYLGDRQLKPGDEVITVAAGFPSTVAPIIQNQLIPVFLDIDIETHNIETRLMESAIGERTKAIFIAHTLGNPFNLKEVKRIANKYNLWLIEDNCDALGSLYENQLTGTFGDIATISFYPAHHITMGEGGCVVTNSELLAKIAKSIRDWGRDCYCDPGKSNTCGKRFFQQFGDLPFGYDHKYVYSHLGYNLKATDMQAAIGVAQLKKLPEFINKRKYNFSVLYENLKEFQNYLILPKKTDSSDPSWFGFLITVKINDQFTRKDLVDFLEKNKIETRNLFAGNLTKQPAFNKTIFRVVGELKNTDFVMNNSFFIGVYPGLTDKHLDYIITIFKMFFSNLKIVD